jgi:hypothetical protein
MDDVDLNTIPRRAIRSAAKYSMLIFSLGLLACGTGQQAAQAQGQSQGQSLNLTCGPALDSLMSQWLSIGFTEPSKPAQMIVSGQHGYSTTGGQFYFMRRQIRIATLDCEQGRDAEALIHIRTVRELLDHARHI